MPNMNCQNKMNDNITTRNLMLRCYANKVAGQWQAFCIDLCLAAQGETFAEVREKLEAMILEYVYDALAGEDREYAGQLLNRKAPFNQIATYHLYQWMHHFGMFKNGIHRLFNESLPLTPQSPLHS